jgi:ribose 1,5-bisphosphate isomerase
VTATDPGRRFALANRLRSRGLPPPSQSTLQALRDIVDEGVLGASNHVALALPLVARIAAETDDPETGWLAAAEASAFIAEVRGAGAPVVANALGWAVAGIAELPAAARAEALAKRAGAWAEAAAARRSALVAAAETALAGCRRPLAYDYSSTVADIVIALARHGLDVIIVPESRAIDGGRRYVEAFAPLGVPIRVLPDAAFEYAASISDAVLLGAESVTADGGVINTIGSLPQARAAAVRGIPVYGAADLFKVGRVASADWPAPPLRRYDALGSAGVSTEAPELELVPPDLVTAILTEKGPLAPDTVGPAAARATGSGS